MSTPAPPRAQSLATASPRPPRLNFSTNVRSKESRDFDDRVLSRRGETSVRAPEFMLWPRFYSYMEQNWNADPEYGAEHMIIVGQAGSGKTTVARELLKLRDYVVVFGTKTRDASLYEPLKAQGYEQSETFDPKDFQKHPKVLFVPKLEEPTVEALRAQRDQFREALLGIFQTGGWTIFCDELRYLTETLKLNHEMDLLWLQGRSLWITIVGLTQRPVSVPLNAFEQATHFILFRISSFNDRKRASEYVGANAPTVYETIKQLPKHEFLYVNKVEDNLFRSKVDRKKNKSGSTSATIASSR